MLIPFFYKTSRWEKEYSLSIENWQAEIIWRQNKRIYRPRPYKDALGRTYYKLPERSSPQIIYI